MRSQSSAGWFGLFGKLGEKPLVCQVAFFVTVAVVIALQDTVSTYLEKVLNNHENIRRR